MKFGNYEKVKARGIIPKNTLVENRDILIAKVVPIKENRNDPTKVIKFEDASRIYRMTRTFLSQDGSVSLRLCSVAPPFGPLVKSDFPEATQVVRMIQNSGLLRYGEHMFTEPNIFIAF